MDWFIPVYTTSICISHHILIILSVSPFIPGFSVYPFLASVGYYTWAVAVEIGCFCLGQASFATPEKCRAETSNLKYVYCAESAYHAPAPMFSAKKKPKCY